MSRRRIDNNINPGQAALALDDLITHPEFARIAEQLQRLVPAWLRDQQLEAARDTEHWLELEAQTIGAANPTAMPATDVPGWLRLTLLDALTGWITSTTATCIHSPHPDRPQLIMAAAWRPGLITCAGCTHLLALPPGSEANRRCDACGHITTGPEHGDGIHPSRIALGPLIFMFGTCRDCLPPHHRPQDPRQ